jgi:hypothetical protein
MFKSTHGIQSERKILVLVVVSVLSTVKILVLFFRLKFFFFYLEIFFVFLEIFFLKIEC